MLDLYKFQIWCNECDAWIIKWGETVDECKAAHNVGRDPAHTFDDSKTAVLQTELSLPPTMADGRPIVRSDTRPLDYETYFTMSGDSTGIGTGQVLRWDFSNSDNDYSGPGIPPGYKCKKVDLTFVCPIHSKDGAIYFFDAPWGCYVDLDIVVSAGNYYPNDAGAIPASALGLSGNQMYSYATENVPYQRFVNKHYIYGTCPMGDELNAEGCSVNPIPIGWILRGIIYTPTSDNTSKGFASFEVYRCHTKLLPGQTIDDLH